MEAAIADIHVGEPRKLIANGTSRVAATVDGQELFFESDEIELCPAPEAFATALLPIAVGDGVRLIMDSPLDPLWLRNVARVLRVWNTWWGTASALGSVLVAPADPDGTGRGPRPAVGLCFSLGVDSFYTLLRSGWDASLLVVAQGYDMALADESRMAAIRDSLDQVGRATGAAPVVVRTNLRDHPVGRRMNWTRAHGGAIAALGHVCGGEIGELLISSTKPYFANRPWGSHWETDPGWSSARVRVTHLGAERRRNDKVAALLDEPLVQRHLRVCWENRAPTGNCGECEKCVRTMLILSVNGRLADFSTFPAHGSLPERLEAVPAIIPDLVPVYRAALEKVRDRRLKRAVERLIERSAPSPSRFGRAVARLRPTGR